MSEKKQSKAEADAQAEAHEQVRLAEEAGVIPKQHRDDPEVHQGAEEDPVIHPGQKIEKKVG